MTVATIIFILFLAAGLALLVFMLCADLVQVHSLDYDNQRFYDWLTSTDEYLTVKRILALVVFIASVTTMAIDSPFVVAALAVGLSALDFALGKKTHVKTVLHTPRAQRLMAITLAFMLIVITVVALTMGFYYAGVTAVFFATFSYAFTLAFNWLLIPVEKSMGKDHSKDNA